MIFIEGIIPDWLSASAAVAGVIGGIAAVVSTPIALRASKKSEKALRISQATELKIRDVNAPMMFGWGGQGGAGGSGDGRGGDGGAGWYVPSVPYPPQKNPDYDAG